MTEAPSQNLTPYAPTLWEAGFLTALSKCGNVSAACRTAKIDRRSAYDRRAAHPEFKTLWEEALEGYADSLEDEAHRRAVTGTLKPVYQRGEKVGTIREYSDTLLVLLLKAARPEKYRERTDITSDGEQLIIAVTKMDVSQL